MALYLLTLALCQALEPGLVEWQPSGATIADPCPEFYWSAGDQTAYRLRVASEVTKFDAADLWDSGWVESPLPLAEYAGSPLPAGRAVSWRIEVRSPNGAETAAPGSFTYRPEPAPRHYPTLRSFLNFSADLDAVVRDYDVTFMPQANERRPEILCFNYSLLATMVIPSEKADQLAAFCVREGLTAEGIDEAMFLHFGEDTPVKLHVGREAADQPIEERLVPGWDPRNDRNGDGEVDDGEAAAWVNAKATARRPAEARVPIYYWGPPRDDFVMNPSHFEYRRFLATDYATSRLPGYDGLYIDTIPPHPPGPAAGAVLAEYRSRPDGWRDDMLRLLAGIKVEHPEIPLVGNAWDSTPFVMDGRQEENWLDLRSTASRIRQRVREARGLDLRGKSQWLQYNNIAVDDEPSFAPRLPVPLDRDRLFGVATYLLAHGERTYYGYGRHPYGKLWRFWPGCAAVDLGEPLGEPTEEQREQPAAEAANLLFNGDFETPAVPDKPLRGWDAAGGFRLATGEGRHGSTALRLTSEGYQQNEIFKQWVKLKPRTVYTLRGWIRTEGVGGQGAQIYPYDLDLGGGTPFISVTGDTDWTRYETVFRTGDDAEGRINVRIFRGPGVAWFDDLELLEGAHAATVVFRRAYEKGLLLVRPFGGGEFDGPAETIALPRPARPVAADGTLGEPVREVPLREAEAAILVWEGGA